MEEIENNINNSKVEKNDQPEFYNFPMIEDSLDQGLIVGNRPNKIIVSNLTSNEEMP